MMDMVLQQLTECIDFGDGDIFGFWEFSTFFGTLFLFSSFFEIFLHF